MAGTTGLEPATSAVTGQHSNQLNYVPTAISQTCRKLLTYWLRLCLLFRLRLTVLQGNCTKQFIRNRIHREAATESPTATE
jgi:hypothetical protein